MGPSSERPVTTVPPAANRQLIQSSQAIKIIDPSSGKEVVVIKERNCTQGGYNIPTTPDISGARETTAPDSGKIEQSNLHDSRSRALQEPLQPAYTVGSSPGNRSSTQSLVSSSTKGADCSLHGTLRKHRSHSEGSLHSGVESQFLWTPKLIIIAATAQEQKRVC